MRWVEFDVSAAHALAYQCTVASDVLRAQGWGRRNSVEVALEDFHGAYALLFADACRLESEDRVALARALDEVAKQVHDVIAAAQREEARLEQAHQDSLRQEEEGVFNHWADQWAPFTDLPYSPPQIETVFSPRIRSRLAGRHNGGGKVGADPQALRTFVEHARGANTALERELRQVGMAWNVFTYRCP